MKTCHNSYRTGKDIYVIFLLNIHWATLLTVKTCYNRQDRGGQFFHWVFAECSIQSKPVKVLWDRAGKGNFSTEYLLSAMFSQNLLFDRQDREGWFFPLNICRVQQSKPVLTDRTGKGNFSTEYMQSATFSQNLLWDKTGKGNFFTEFSEYSLNATVKTCYETGQVRVILSLIICWVQQSKPVKNIFMRQNRCGQFHRLHFALAV